jgi:NAD(P)-dependent dehydrogenase (short-subunit alcohol dehydrogenase family)
VGLLEDKVVLRAGGARGQGRALAREVADGLDPQVGTVRDETAGREGMAEAVRHVGRGARLAELRVFADVRSHEQQADAVAHVSADWGSPDGLIVSARC